MLSVFMLGRLVSSYPLGLLSDRVGRRPVIELGLLSCVVFQIGFALSPFFPLALFCRFLMGAFNGIIGVAKAWLPELVSPDRQAFAMSMISGMWGIGQVAATALGGLLYGVGSTDSGPLAVVPLQFLPNAFGSVLSGASISKRKASPTRT